MGKERGAYVAGHLGQRETDTYNSPNFQRRASLLHRRVPMIGVYPHLHLEGLEGKIHHAVGIGTGIENENESVNVTYRLPLSFLQLYFDLG